jgi:MFS family permease
MALRISGKDGFYGWVNLAVMFGFNIVIFCFVLNAFGFCLPYWVKEFGWTRGAISGAQTVSLVLTGLAAPLVGIFLMRQGARKAIVLGNILTAAVLLLMSFQTHIWELYLWCGVVMGIGMSMGGMLAMMTVTNNWFIMKRSVAMAISMGAMGLNVVFGPLLMTVINQIGWRKSYVIIAILTIVFCSIIPGILVRNKPEDIGQVPDGPASKNSGRLTKTSALYKNLDKTCVDFTAKEALRTRTLWLLTIYGTVQFFCINALMPHQVAFLFDLGLTPKIAAMASGLLTAVMSISSLGVGFLGLRFKMRSLATISIVIGMLGFGTILIAKSLPLVIAYCIILGIGFGIQGIAMGNLFPDYFGRSEFPKIMGYTTPVTTIGSSLGAPIAGYIRDTTGSYIPAFQICIVMLSLGFLCIIFAKPPIHPSLKDNAEAAKLNTELAT